MRITSKIGVFAASLCLVFALGSPVLAVNANAQQSGEQTQSQTTQTTRTQTQTEKKEQIQAKLNATKLKVCKNREKTINNIMARIADRGQKQIDLFTTIAEKTQAFYTKKGKTLSNYQALVDDVNAKKSAAVTALDNIKADVTFKCDGTDPKGTANSFKESLKAEIAAIKAYKTSVRNLIVGVKSVQGTTSSASPTPSVSSTPTEEVQNAQ